jgi:hypothetical protein
VIETAADVMLVRGTTSLFRRVPLHRPIAARIPAMNPDTAPRRRLRQINPHLPEGEIREVLFCLKQDQVRQSEGEQRGRALFHEVCERRIPSACFTVFATSRSSSTLAHAGNVVISIPRIFMRF